MPERDEARRREERRRKLLERLNSYDSGVSGEEREAEARSRRGREIDREKNLKYARMHWGTFF